MTGAEGGSPRDEWTSSSLRPSLRDGEVHVWKADLRISAEELQCAGALLNEEERNRAARYHFDADRKRFIAARAILRVLLASYSKASAGGLQFEYGREGKPSLRQEEAEPPVSFNMAHSSHLALFAITSGLPVGVDAESIRIGENWEEVAADFFSPSEIFALRQVPHQNRNSEFFRIWTRKEAFVKGLGKGLSTPLDGFSVVGDPDQPVLSDDLETAGEFPRWFLYDLAPEAGSCGALAVPDQRLVVRTFQWRPESAPPD